MKYPIANPMLVLREEFDDWAVLFDPDTGKAFGLNPASVFIWKKLDGKHSPEEISKGLCENFENVPLEAEKHIDLFLQELADKGLVGQKVSAK